MTKHELKANIAMKMCKYLMANTSYEDFEKKVNEFLKSKNQNWKEFLEQIVYKKSQ